MSKVKGRPYISHSIDQLEELFDDGRSDMRVLEQLAHELDSRKTNRAAKLRASVTDALTTQSSKGKNAVVIQNGGSPAVQAPSSGGSSTKPDHPQILGNYPLNF